MKYPHIDKRTKEDLIDYIKKIAPYYVPEWRFNEEDLDMGSVLATIFVNMFKDTIDRFNQVPYNNFLNFLNIVGAKLLPSIPAKGYITFNLVDGADEGVFVKKGEKLSASPKDEDSNRIIFETEKNIFVTPSKIKYIYNCSYNNDSIIKTYDYEENEKPQMNLFSKNGINLQKHEFKIKHKDVLNLTQTGRIKIFFHMDDEIREKELCNMIIKYGKWSYFNGEKYIPLNSVINDKNSIVIYKDFISDDSEMENVNDEIGVLKCELDKIYDHVIKAYVNNITLKSKGNGLIPDIIVSGDIECDNTGFLVFGERFSVYDDFYISCREAFSKKGAYITLKFNMEFLKIKIENYEPEPEIEWKLIMKKSKFKAEKEYEISIEEVIFEYWNGIGWAKLNLNKNCSKIFNYNNDLQKKQVVLEFMCPSDIAMTVVNSYDGLFIRGRILKINNEYRTRGFYIAPYADNVKINYEYVQDVVPEKIETYNNMVKNIYTEGHIKSGVHMELIEKVHTKNNVIYFALDKKPSESPIRILFILNTIFPKDRPSLIWEYWNGDVWRVLNLADETENMRKSGIVSFSGEEDFQKKVLFKKNMYWIRVYNLSSYYENENIVLPQIENIFINTVPIIQKDSKEEELFFIDKYEKNKKINVVEENLNTVEVWVNEYKNISREEILEIPKKHIKIMRNSIGEIEEVWIMWSETDDLIMSDKNDRHYIVDRNEGIISFGDGINGKVPPGSFKESIKIIYSTGGGESGNLDCNEINDMVRSIGYINKVFNPLPTSGGCNMEKIDEAIERNPCKLKHRNKAVTCSDYEKLVLEGNRNISKVKCFSGLNEEGEKEEGNVTVVVLPKGNFKDNLYFNILREQIRDYLEERNFTLLNVKHKLNIIFPCFINISVKVEAETYDLDNIFSVKQEIEDAINRFIDPINGNFNRMGWEIGDFPVREKIINCLKFVNGIKRVLRVVLSASTNINGKIEDIDIEKYKKNIYGIPLNGTHTVKVYADRNSDLL